MTEPGADRPRPRPDPDRPGTVYRSRSLRLRTRSRTRPPTGGGPNPSRTPNAGEAASGNATPIAAGAPVATQAPAGPAPWSPPVPTPAGRRRRPRLGLVALLVAGVLLAYVLGLFAVAWASLHRVDALGGSGRIADTPGRTFLVVGSDSRAALTPAERRRLGTGSTTGSRTDTIMLLHVPSHGGPTVLVSIPRDSYVPIPGHGSNKINAAYAFGGPQLLVRTVEQATGVHIDEYVETGLLGYADLVDAIGGVRICSPRAMNDKDAHLNIPAGCQQMDGKTALGYARARHSDPRGDLGRVERQRQVLAAIAGKTLSASVLALPWRALPAAHTGGAALTVDSGTSPPALARFVLAMRAVAGGKGLSLTVPVGNPNLSTPVGSAVEWDHARARRLFADLRADNTEAIRSLA